MIMKHTFLFCLIFVFFVPNAKAQAPVQSMNANPVMVAEATFLNPAYLQATQKKQINFLPFMAAQVQISNNLLSNGTLLKYLQNPENTEQNNNPARKLISNLKPNNSINLQADFTLMHVALRLGGKESTLHTGISIRQHFLTKASMNADLLRVLYEGNKQFAGQTVSLKPEISILGYTDIGWSLSKTFEINDLKITPAFRLRYLIGEAAVYTKEAKLGMYTEENGEYIDVTGQLNGYAGGVINAGQLFNSENEEDSEIERTPTGKGAAIDLGVTLSYKNISLSFASIDNGRIRFKGNSAWYISSQNSSYRWEGYDIAAELNGDEDAGDHFAPLESIDLKGKQKDFSVGIGSKFTLNGNYGLIGKTDKKTGTTYYMHNAGISLIQGVKSHFNLSRPNWTVVYYQINLGNRLTAGINYNNCLGFSDLGANIGFRLASLNIGLGSNSMLAFVNPDASRKLDLFLHLGLAF